MPKKTFLNGYPLPASDLNTYLMDQSVMTFASAAARTSAIPAPTEGMTTYLEDVNQVQVYNGTAWEGLVTTTNVGSLAPQGNAVINGGFDINQRSFTTTTGTDVYTFDRWKTSRSGGTVTYSAQTFTPGAAPVAGYEGSKYIQIETTGQAAAGDYAAYGQRVEDVRTLAGRTVTVSFFAKAASGTPKVGLAFDQNFGSGGSSVVTTNGGSVTVSTSFARYSITVAVPSLSGKTLGVSSFLETILFTSAGSGLAAYTSIGLQNATVGIWGVQLEAGTVATPFKRNAPSIQAELAACQRYLASWTSDNGYSAIGFGLATNVGNAEIVINHPTTLRAIATSPEWSTLALWDGNTLYPATTVAFAGGGQGTKTTRLVIGATGLTTYRPYELLVNNNVNAYLRLPAEF